MSCLGFLAVVAMSVIAWAVERARRERFADAAREWARRHQLEVVELTSRKTGCGGVFWRYNPNRHYHFRVTLRTAGGRLREGWIICKQGLFSGSPTDDISLEYID